MADWRFEFIDNTSQNDANADKMSGIIPDTLGSGINDKPISKPSSSSKQTFSNEFEKKIEKDSIRQYIVSPLNTVTGGLASPLYMSARKLVKGATFGAVAGELVATGVLMAVSAGISALQNRMKELETKVAELGNADNVLIKSGSVTMETYYSSNIWGIKSKTNRS